jgi:hypothetical protein
MGFAKRNVVMNKALVATACAIGVGAGVHLLSNTTEEAVAVDPGGLTPDQQRYCDRVDQWYREEMLDVEPKWRHGHPDERGTYAEWCTDM